MRYQRVNDNLIEIQPERDPIKIILLTIARISYETSIPRGLGHLQPYQAPPMEVRFEDYIEPKGGEDPTILLMSYIHGRDCRTKVSKTRDGKWHFDAYVFQQRKVTSEEFSQGIVKDPAERFLDQVVQELIKREQN